MYCPFECLLLLAETSGAKRQSAVNATVAGIMPNHVVQAHIFQLQQNTTFDVPKRFEAAGSAKM